MLIKNEGTNHCATIIQVSVYQRELECCVYLSLIFVHNAIWITQAILVHWQQILCTVNTDTYHASNCKRFFRGLGQLAEDDRMNAKTALFNSWRPLLIP